MSLLNYTTKIDPDKTAQEIAKCLSLHGAQAVLTEYDEKESIVSAISFKVKMGEQSMSFRLPCDWKPVYEVMTRDKAWRESNDSKYKQRMESDWRLQAVRTAWRIVKDWVEAQMALVETQMVTTSQVFLPYMLMGNQKTLAENMVNNPNLPNMLLGDGQ